MKRGSRRRSGVLMVVLLIVVTAATGLINTRGARAREHTHRRRAAPAQAVVLSLTVSNRETPS